MPEEVRRITVQLETVTPLWMGGAGHRPELRPPSMRGMLRFWLRSLLGGTLGEDLVSLRRAETAVFGDPQQASSVVVRIDGAEAPVGPALMSDEEFPGVAYLFWSMYQRKREAILPGGTFDLHLQGRPWQFSGVEVKGVVLGRDEAFHLSAAALWLLLRLGGAGARSRRGAGVLRAAAQPAAWPETLPSPVETATTPAELARELTEGLQAIRRSLPWQSAAAPQKPSSFDVLHPDACQLFVIDRTFPTWWEGLDWVGQQFHEFRRAHRADASAVAQLLTRGRTAVATIQRAVLGLPIQFFFKSMYESFAQGGMPPKEARRRASAMVTPDRRLGRVSPLLLRVVPLAGQPQQFAIVVMLFRSRFLPERQIMLRPQDRSIRPVRVDAPSDHGLIDRWFDSLKNAGAELKEVSFGTESRDA